MGPATLEGAAVNVAATTTFLLANLLVPVSGTFDKPGAQSDGERRCPESRPSKSESRLSPSLCAPGLFEFSPGLRYSDPRTSPVSLDDETPESTPVAPAASAPDAVATEPAGVRVVVVVGAAGTAEYGETFGTWAERWRAAAEKGGAECTAVGLDGDVATRHPAGGDDGGAAPNDRERLEAAIGAAHDAAEVWCVLIGHGTFDGRTARFNLRGPDVSAAELAEWLRPCRGTAVVVNTASSSGPFVNALSGRERVVVTATKSGEEHFFTRFGEHLSAAIGDTACDLDKDGQVSLFEAWLFASRRTEAFYKDEGRLATEHGLLDDNGDGRGTRADAFTGLRPTKRGDGGELDGGRAHQLHLVRSERERSLTEESRRRRDELERSLAELRARSGEWPEAEYLERIEPLLVELAELYEAAERE
jgi:hypothetical protein